MEKMDCEAHVLRLSAHDGWSTLHMLQDAKIQVHIFLPCSLVKICFVKFWSCTSLPRDTIKSDQLVSAEDSEKINVEMSS